MSRPGRCPNCDVDLEADDTAVRCWRCGWEVRDVDHPRLYADLRAELEAGTRPGYIPRNHGGLGYDPTTEPPAD